MSDEAIKLSEEVLTKFTEQVLTPFYFEPSFIIGTIIGLTSVIVAFMAFYEARGAKQAASEAGKTVKIQTITIDLTEIAQRLDTLDFNLGFSEARDLLNEVSRKLRRLIAPFQSNDDMSEACDNLKTALNDAKEALENVRPPSDIDKTDESDINITANSIYFATQGHFANISDLVAEIMGLFEKRNIEVQK